MKIVIAGGSGAVGAACVRYFAPLATELVILSRQPARPAGKVHTVIWDGKTTGLWAKSLDGADLLINLTGKNVNCRYTAVNQAAILSSRLDSTRVLGEAIQHMAHPPKVWIQMSSATIYRHAEDRPMDEEQGEFGDTFSEQVCRAWEAACLAAHTPHTRKVLLRTGIVLDRQGGALPRLINLVYGGCGGQQGNGRQYVSWIHEEDVARAIHWLYQQPEASGVYNCTAPVPVNNRAFMRALRRACRVPLGLPTPAWLLQLGAWLIGTETELVLKSRWVLPARLEREGFIFRYRDVDTAFRKLMRA